MGAEREAVKKPSGVMAIHSSFSKAVSLAIGEPVCRSNISTRPDCTVAMRLPSGVTRACTT
ncbi:hypothetical protein D3C83_194450 [compost metagenome]